MKTNFKKTLAVFLAVLMLSSIFSVIGLAARTYTVTYKPGKGVEGNQIVNEFTDKITLLGETYYKDGYVQVGWATSDGGSKKYNFNQRYSQKKNLVLYPVWEVAVEYTVTYKPGTGVDGEEFVDKTFTSNVQFRDVTYTRDGFVQTGWTLTDGGTTRDYGLNATFNMSSLNVTEIVLYPYWEGVAYTVSYIPDSYSKETEVVTQSANFNASVPLKEALFTREGYIQTGWALTEGGERKYEVGKMSDIITGDLDLYPVWSKKCDVVFMPGQYGEGDSETIIILEGTTATLKGALFTRAGYTQRGWSTTDGGEMTYELYEQGVVIESDTILYPYWVKNVYALEFSQSTLNFGDNCLGYITAEAQDVVITNKGNVPVTLNAAFPGDYDIQLSGTGVLNVGESITITLQPKTTLGLGDYSQIIKVSTVEAPAVVYDLVIKFTVTDHFYDEYVSANDATYTQDGRLVAECVKGCGHKDYKENPGSKKVFSVDNNDAIGLEAAYIHHRTVRFTAYGSGMDDTEDYLKTRFRPVSWYVNDEFNGEFENGYDVTFTHTIFGEYTLTINYVEETKDEATGEWVETGVTDTKTFSYTVGTTAEEEQEIVRPNTILNIIFGLFQQLLALLGIGG